MQFYAIILVLYSSPLLQLFLSFPNTNPVTQEHTCHSFRLLQIWLHPPLLLLSQGCTKICKYHQLICFPIMSMHINTINIHILTNLPFLQVFLSSSKVYPASQEQACFLFNLLQIWLQPPLFSSSHGCTKDRQLVKLIIFHCDNY